MRRPPSPHPVVLLLTMVATLYTLSTHYLLTVYTLSTHCLHTVYTLSTHCLLTDYVHSLSTCWSRDSFGLCNLKGR